MPYLKIGDSRIHYIKHGNGSPLVLFHGVFGNASLYHNIIKILGKKFTVYAPDLPYHGKSSCPNNKSSLDGLDNMLSIFIKKLGINKPIIMGHSAGAIFAINYASKNEISKLILSSPSGLGYNQPGKNTIKSVFLGLFKVSIQDFYESPVSYFRILRVFIFNLVRNTFNRGFWRTLNQGIHIDEYSELEKIKAKSYLVFSGKDRLYSSQHFMRFKHILRRPTVVKVNGGHNWPITYPEEINRVLHT